MLYNTIEIRPTLDGHWQVLHREIPYERKKGEQWLNGVIGTFHYPRNWGKEKAFKVLRNRMIEERLKVIKVLQNQIEQLRALMPKENSND